MNHLAANNIPTDPQHGLRPKYSCESSFITTFIAIMKQLD